MSLYSHGFTLLPRPPRFGLQLGDEATRLVIPDFETVEQFRVFIRRVLIIQIDIPGFYPQVMFCASVVAFLTIVVALIIGRRMYEKSFWLVRVMNRPSGRILVPNALLAFVVAEGAYAALFVSYMWVHRSWYGTHSHLPNNLLLFMCLTWCPLIAGPMLAVWGTMFAGTSLTASSEHAVSPIKLFLTHAVIINSAAILIPVLGFLAIAIPTFLANEKVGAALHLQQDWLARYANATDFSQAMLTDAQRLWFLEVDGFHVSSIAMVIWTVFALCVGVAYLIVSWRLISVVGRELRKSRDGAHRLDMVATTYVVSHMAQYHSSRGENDCSARFTAQSAPSTPNFSKGEVDSRPTLSFASTEVPARRRALPASLSPVSSRGRRILVALDKLCPNIIAKTEEVPVPSVSLASRQIQIGKLRKAYYHLFIQLIVVAPGCVVFAGLALWAAIELAGSVDQPLPGLGGGTKGERAQGLLILTMCWSTVTLGCGTLLAVAQRTYEPVFSSLHQSLARETGTGSSQEQSHEFQLDKKRGGPTASTFFETSDPHTTSTFFETTSFSLPSPKVKDDPERITPRQSNPSGDDSSPSNKLTAIPLAMRRYSPILEEPFPIDLERVG